MEYAITAQDKRALLAAPDGLSFHMRDGQGFIRAHKRGAHTADGFDTYHEVPTSTFVRDFNRDTYVHDDLSGYTGFHMEHGHHDESRTMMARLRVGDMIHLSWWRSNNNEAGRAVDFHRDELRMVIRRASGKDETFLVAVSVGPDNTARMVRCV